MPLHQPAQLSSVAAVARTEPNPPVQRLHDQLATLHPAYFGLVMATGMVSIGCALLGFALIGRVLLFANSGLYLVLWTLLVSRVIKHRERVLSDLAHHGRAVGFFTTVAATSVMGSQWLLIGGAWRLAAALWVMTIVLWAVVTYTVFTILTVTERKPTLDEGINGGWLLSVVAAQSVAVLGTQLAPGFAGHAPEVLLFCLVTWLGAGMLYIWIISLIFYRYTFFVMQPSDLTPPYWINMGAVAISTLAGSLLALASPHARLLTDLLPFIKGLTLMFWATATWWIPMLVILGVWRHIYRRFPLRYDPLYWGAVFPLGMYAVATLRLAQALDASVLLVVPPVFVFLALAAWMTTSAGLIRQIVRS